MYQWGFSFIQLFMMITMLLIWTIGILTIWIHARDVMRKRGQDTVAGAYKAVIDLAAAMQEELGTDGASLAVLTEKELQQRVANAQGGSISYSLPILTQSDLRSQDAWKWLKRERWWLLVTFLCVVTTCTVWMASFWASILLTGTSFGLIFSIISVSTVRSRVLFTLLSTLLCLIPATVLFFILFPSVI